MASILSNENEFEIQSLIGETTDYDKKQMLEVKNPRTWLKSVSAFANGIGGKLIFGIEDKSDRIIGLVNAEKDAEIISEMIRDKMDPVPSFTLRFVVIEGKKLIILNVASGDETPYYFVGRNERTAYHRVGNESVICDAGKMRELALKGSGKTFDSLPSGYKFSEMSFTKLRSVYFQRSGKELRDSDFKSFGLVEDNGILTNAGALMADESPIRHSRVFCTRWNGLTKASGLQEALDDAEYSGSVIILLQESIDFVKRNSRKGWFKTADRRIELPDYPERSVTEGIVNALIHRNYMEMGSEVHIDIYDDRLEIYSPGGMFDGINVQDRDILNVPSRRRNPIIADLFSRLDYMERRGSGFKKILNDYKNQYYYLDDNQPVFYSKYDAFFLTLRNVNYALSAKGINGMALKEEWQNEWQNTAGSDQKGPNQGPNMAESDPKGPNQGPNMAESDQKESNRYNQNYKIDINERTKAVFQLIRENPHISNPELAEKLGVTIKQIRIVLEILQKQERIQRTGKTRGAYWMIIEEIGNHLETKRDR